MNKMFEIEQQMNQIDMECSSDEDKLSIMSDKLNGIEFNKYHNGKIYRLSSDEAPGVYYYGSTTQTLSGRKLGHQSNYKRYLKGKFNYLTSFKLVKYLDCQIELVAKIRCNNKKELEEIEALYIKNNKCVNKFIPCRSKKQYDQDNHDKIKQYRSDNRDKIREKQDIKFDCACGGKYTMAHKAKHIRTQTHQEYLSSTSQSD